MFKYAEIRTGNCTLLGFSFEAARSCGYNACFRFHNKFTVNICRSILVVSHQHSVVMPSTFVSFILIQKALLNKPSCRWSQDLIHAFLQKMNHAEPFCNINVWSYWTFPEFIIEYGQEAAISEILMPFAVKFSIRQKKNTPLSTMLVPWHWWPWPATKCNKSATKSWDSKHQHFRPTPW